MAQDSGIVQAKTEELIGAMDALGVPFLAGGWVTARALSLSPADLLFGLAYDPDARVRLAVIPLLLLHPEYSIEVPEVAKQLEGDARLTFQFYYTAAYWLQRKHATLLSEFAEELYALPDYFSIQLSLAGQAEADGALEELGKRHQELSHEKLNWRGTYEHAASWIVRHIAWRSHGRRARG